MNKQIINAAIKQSGHYADILNGVLYVSKSFQTNANYYNVFSNTTNIENDIST